MIPGDATALAAAIPKADAAGVDADVLAAAKKAQSCDETLQVILTFDSSFRLITL